MDARTIVGAPADELNIHLRGPAPYPIKFDLSDQDLADLAAFLATLPYEECTMHPARSWCELGLIIPVLEIDRFGVCCLRCDSVGPVQPGPNALAQWLIKNLRR